MTNTAGSDRRAFDHLAPAAHRLARLRTAVLSSSLAAAAIGLTGAQAQSDVSPGEPASACATRAGWIDVTTGRSIDRGELFRDLVAKGAVVLLGESHIDVNHHRWQLQTLAALHGRGGNVVIGFEAFPRRLQSVLNDWVDGKLTEEVFLKASEWRQVWGYDAALYMPLFEFARLNHIPMIAMNVERRLVSRVGRDGWEAVPASEREGLSKPGPATEPYQRDLARVYALKKLMPPGTDPASIPEGTPMPEPDEAALTGAMQEADFQRFVAAQQTWDRGMAEALAGASRKFPDATVVGILGSGHVADGHGVPHQLKDLGVALTTSLIPVSTDTACKLVGTTFADAVFTLPRMEETPPPDRPQLGVFLTQGDGAPRITQVAGGSVAEA